MNNKRLTLIDTKNKCIVCYTIVKISGKNNLFIYLLLLLLEHVQIVSYIYFYHRKIINDTHSEVKFISFYLFFVINFLVFITHYFAFVSSLIYFIIYLFNILFFKFYKHLIHFAYINFCCFKINYTVLILVNILFFKIRKIYRKY